MCDVYNPMNKPVNTDKLARVNVPQQVTATETDDSYLSKVQFKVLDSISTSYPEFIIYIAGYDLVAND